MSKKYMNYYYKSVIAKKNYLITTVVDLRQTPIGQKRPGVNHDPYGLIAPLFKRLCHWMVHLVRARGQVVLGTAYVRELNVEINIHAEEHVLLGIICA